jgi:hypothetical protein
MDGSTVTFHTRWLLYLPHSLLIKNYHFAYKMVYGPHKILTKKLLPYTEFTACSLDRLKGQCVFCEERTYLG